MFSISLIAIFLPHNLLSVHGEISFDFSFMLFFLKELLLGFILGFLAMVPFLTAQMAGSLIDFQRGASSLQVSDPTTQTQTGPVGLLCNFFLIAVFFLLNGPFLFLNAVADSYTIIPVDKLIDPSFFLLKGTFFEQITSLAGRMMRIAAQLAAPALIGILLTDLFLGIANRLAPQVQIVFLGIALKSWVGLALLTAAWGFMIQVMSKDAIDWMTVIKNLIYTFAKPA
jgi:type III secretory pathway component EscT